MKDEGAVIGTAENQTIRYMEQDGSKHYMLCGDCESWLGEAERYLSLLARGTAKDLRSAGIVLTDGPRLQNVNFKLVMRGILGIIYKIHHATAVPLDKINLDEKLISRMRTRILQDDYPTNSILISATKWLGAGELKANPKAMMIPEYADKPGGPKIFDLMMGGWSWSVGLTSPNWFLRDFGDSDLFLHPNRSWLVLVGDLAMHRYYAKDNYYDQLEVDEDLAVPWDVALWGRIDPAEACPCGLGELAFADCCMGRWVDTSAEAL